MVYDNILEAPKAATISWDTETSGLNQSDRRLGVTPSGEEFSVSHDDNFAVIERTLNYNEGPFLNIVDLNNTASTSTGNFDIEVPLVNNVGEYWQLFSSISNNGEDLAYLQTENFMNQYFPDLF